MFRLVVVTEKHFEYVGSGNSPLRLDFGMQSAVGAHVIDQARILLRLCLVMGNQCVHEAEFGQLREYVVDRVVHRIERIDQRRVPIEQHDARRHKRSRCFIQFA